MNFEQLKTNVEQWAKDKDLLHEENADKQFMKFMEEVFEFKFEMQGLKNYQDSCELLDIEGTLGKNQMKRNMQLEMGDIIVTLIVLCKQLDIDIVECLDMAYDKISKRKGKTVNGLFVKEEDLRWTERKEEKQE